MSRVIDDKVVAMSFENSKFEAGVHESLSSIDKLKHALKFDRSAKGLDDVNAAAKRVDLSHIGQGVDGVQRKLESLRLVAIGVMSQLSTQAIRFGGTLAKQFTIEPLKAGFKEYATNLNAVQTILANTQAAGVGIKDVNATLDELNEFSDKTIYNFGQMARNIGTFTAAGVDLKTATASIKGIADLAALSGSNADQAATAMYQLSQAISAGRVGLQDWNSVVNAGMGGTVFQRALATTAENMGTLKKGTLKLVGPMKNVSINGESFRQSMQAGPGKQSWLTSKVLTETLKQFTGDLTDAELAAKGFSKEQIKSIQQTAQTAMHAATEVKTIQQVLSVAQETAGSGWANTWRIVFGDFEEAKKTFTSLSNTINGFINKSADARNAVLGDWKKLGGRKTLIEGIKNAFEALGKILAPIRAAFRSFFPATTGKQLFEFTKSFKELTDRMMPSIETFVALKRIFGGVFAVLDIGKEIIFEVIGLFRELIGSTSVGGGGFLLFAAKIGTSLKEFHEWLIEGGRLAKFFDTLGDILKVPIKLFQIIASAVSGLFSGFSPEGISDKTKETSGAFEVLHDILKAVGKVIDKMVDSMGGMSGVFQKFLDIMVAVIQEIAPALGNAAANLNFEAVLSVIRTGLFAALVLMFKNFLGPGSALQQLTGNNSILGNLKGTMGALRGQMVAMQTNVKADTLKKIAIAVALLAASVVALSLVDPERLKSALTAMAVAFGQLLGAMVILEKISVGKGFLKMPFITASLIALAAAIDLLSIAVLAMSRLSWEQLAKGLGGVAVLLGAISVAVIPLSANSAGMVRAGIGITGIAIALNLLALAVKQFAGMNLKELGKGLGAVAVGLAIMVKAMTGLPYTGMIRAGVAITIIATGLNVLAEAVKKFSSMNMKELGKGLLGITLGLEIMMAAMKIMPKGMVAQAAALVILAGALNLIAKAVTTLSKMSMKEIAKGLGALAGALAILAAALHVMSANIAGAVSLGIVAAGVALLVPALIALGKQSWKSIIKGMVALAGALAILGVAGLALAPVTPALMGLGVALLLIGGGLALAGAAVFLFATGFSALVVAFPTGVGVMVAAMQEFTRGVIENVKLFILGLLEIVEALAKVAPKFVVALVKILKSLLDVVIKAIPKIAEAFNAFMDAALGVIVENAPKIVRAGFQLLLDLLKGIKDNIGKIVPLVSDIIVKFLHSLAGNTNKIVRAGFDVLIAFLRGIGDNLTRVATTVADIIIKFITAVGGKYNEIIKAGFNFLVKFLEGIGSGAKEAIIAGGKMIAKIIEGIGKAAEDIAKAARETAGHFMKTMAKEIPKLAQQVFDAIIILMNGMADVIESDKNQKEFRDASKHLGFAIIDGMTLGLAGKAKELYKKAKDVGQKALDYLKRPWRALSPSRTMIELGENIIDGWVKGLDKNASDVYASAKALSNGFLDIVTDIFRIQSPSKTMMELGKFVTQGFAQGIRGSKDEVTNAFTDMTDTLSKATADLRAEWEKENAELIRLQHNKPSAENSAAIEKQVKVVYKLIDAHGAARNARNLWVKGFKDERTELTKLSTQYEKLGAKLEKAKDILEQARQTRDEAIKSFTDQYSTLPSIVTEDAEGNAVDQLATYMGALDTQAKAVAAYQNTLDQLRKLGLDDATYQKLLEEGTADQNFANQLLAGGKTAVDSLNKLDTQLMTVSKKLATNAAANLYQAGIDAAKGIVKGLESQRSSLKKQMESLARDMVIALKKELKIKSPSEVFAELGKNSVEGFAKGFSNSTTTISDAVTQAGKEAIDSLRHTVRNMSSIVSDELNPNPVITPVLDLTELQRQAKNITPLDDLFLTPTASLGQAKNISISQNGSEITESETKTPSVIHFEQTNNSPESLSPIEIYRQTKNMVSQLKTVLEPV